MKSLPFEVTARKPLRFSGKIRSISFHRKRTITLSHDGRIVGVWGDKSPNRVPLVFSRYWEGNFHLGGIGEGVIELFEDGDKDAFDPKLHQSIFTLD